MSNIDTIREALIKLRSFAKSLDCDYQDKCTQGDDDICQSCKHVYIADEALAALSAIEADIKKVELDSAMSWLDDYSVEPSYDTMRKLCTRLVRSTIAHDDAIRRECADRAVDFCSSWNINSEWLRATILGTEPAREES